MSGLKQNKTAKQSTKPNEIQTFLREIDPTGKPGMTTASLSCVEVGVCAGPQVKGSGSKEAWLALRSLEREHQCVSTRDVTARLDLL